MAGVLLQGRGVGRHGPVNPMTGQGVVKRAMEDAPKVRGLHAPPPRLTGLGRGLIAGGLLVVVLALLLAL